MADKLPDEIIDLILSFAPNFHDNLLSCHKEMLTHNRPIYYKKLVAGFTPGLGDSQDWDNFKRNHEIRIWRRATRGNHNPPLIFMKLNLYAIEITPERTPGVGEYWPTRDIILYYGWTKITNKYFWNTVCKWNQYNSKLCPGFY